METEYEKTQNTTMKIGNISNIGANYKRTDKQKQLKNTSLLYKKQKLRQLKMEQLRNK